MPKRFDAADTVDSVTHGLHRDQSDGWVLETQREHVEYGTSEKGGPRLPVRKHITITLIPSRER